MVVEDRYPAHNMICIPRKGVKIMYSHTALSCYMLHHTVRRCTAVAKQATPFITSTTVGYLRYGTERLSGMLLRTRSYITAASRT